METWFRVDKYSFEIRPRKAVKATEKFLFLTDTMRVGLETSEEKHFADLDEAVAYARAGLEHKISYSEANIRRAQADLDALDQKYGKEAV